MSRIKDLQKKVNHVLEKNMDVRLCAEMGLTE